MNHESRCIHFPCTCVEILRQKLEKLEADKYSNDKAHLELMGKYNTLEKHIETMSCCCSGCTKHNQDIQEKVRVGL